MNKFDEKKWVLISSCIFVKGYKRSLIVDTQYEKAFFVPHALLETILKHQGVPLTKIKLEYKNEYDSILDDYFDFLIKNEILSFTDMTDSFPPLSLKWDSSSKITNAIIDINTGSNFDFNSIFNQLDMLGRVHLQIRFLDFNIIELDYLNEILKFTEGKRIFSIEILIKYNKNTSKKDIQKLATSNNRLTSIIVYSAETNEAFNQIDGVFYEDLNTVRFSKSQIQDHKSCGIINQSYFSYNLDSLTESHHHNSCLNRKISIDVDGNIKNCPSMPQSFGNIKDTTLQEALDQPDFKKYWNVTKDQIEVCKDCEFRYICTDCRAYTEHPENMYAKPLKCGYNPYTCEWEEWSTNPLKQKAIDFYGMREVLPEFKMKPDYVPNSNTGAA